VTTRSVRCVPFVALAVIGALTLGGCGELPAGAASVVDGTTISRSDVNELADAQCAGIEQESKKGQTQTASTPRKKVVQQALTLLMDVELSLKYAKSVGVTPRSSEASATYNQIDPVIQALPKQYVAFMSRVFRRWAEGRDVLTQIGERATGQAPTTSNGDTLINAGYQQREPWLKKIKIDTDPRYGPAGVGWPGGSDPSVSKAVSTFAKSGNKAQPTASWVTALPANQKCG
jgi:hypothetical protein